MQVHTSAAPLPSSCAFARGPAASHAPFARAVRSRHWFHLACVSEYREKMQSPNCPLCRVVLTGSVTICDA